MTLHITRKINETDIALLVLFDKTEVGRKVFDLLADIRTRLSEQGEEPQQGNLDDLLADILEDIDDILTPLGNARDG